MRHLDAVIQKAPTKHRMREVLEWIYFVQDGRWDSEGAEPELCGEGEMEAADAEFRRAVKGMGAERVWAGEIPRGLHGRLVWAGESETTATKLIRELGKEVTKAARAVWKARCEWVNEEETRVQKRNRWREAVRRVGARLDLCDLTRKQAVDMANKKFAKVWKGMCKSMEENRKRK